PSRVSWDGCDGPALADCLTSFDGVSFGSPGPWVAGGVLFPGGSLSFDSGVVMGAPVNLTEERAVVEVTFTQATDCGSTCFDGVGAAFTTQTTLDARTHVHPLVGLLLSGSRDEVSLVVEDQVLGSWERTLVPG